MTSNTKLPEGNWFIPSGYALHNLITKAIKRGATVFFHEAVDFDTDKKFLLGTYFSVPSPQKTGTLYQQDSYAKMKAWEFMSNHKLS